MQRMREAIVGEKKPKKIKNSSIKIFLDCFFTRANDYMRQ